MKDKIKQFLTSDLFVPLLIVVFFLITNRYIYGWDDQHLEIPLLKHLIDPALYQGDYYVESLKNNFTSFLYPILAKIITVKQIPAVYLGLFLVVRYVMFYWVYRIWMYISKGDRLAAFLCSISIFMIGRTEEFIYRTFSHQEFSYMFMFAGLFFFYRERYFWAALIFGLGANFHALYCLFPMLYLVAYLILFQKEKKISLIIRSGLTFMVSASPFIIWTFVRAFKDRVGADPAIYDNWMELYFLACPQTFIFDKVPLEQAVKDTVFFFKSIQSYLFIMALYVFHCVVNDNFRKDKKTHAIAFTVFLLTLITWIFTYVIPSHFVLDLNLVRNQQYILFFLAGHTVLLAWRYVNGPLWKLLLLSVIVAFSGGKELADPAIVCVVAAIIAIVDAFQHSGRALVLRWLVAIVLTLLAGLYSAQLWASFSYTHTKIVRYIGIAGAWFVLSALFFFLRNKVTWTHRIGKAIVIVPFVAFFVYYCQLHATYLQITRHGGGFWQLQRNWEDMQHYVQKNTPKDALIMAPNDMEMGGFRIHSDRKLLVDYRDSGIIGFDMAATVEWHRRMKDIDAFKVVITEPFTDALKNGIVKYRVDYIIFMKYAAVSINNVPFLHKEYENEAFTLFKVFR